MRTVCPSHPPYPKLGRTAVAIGIFDGVHRGHQSLLRLAQQLARRDQLSCVALSFAPHPAQILRPAAAPRLIEPVARRLLRLEALGCDVAWVQHFDHQFAAMQPEAFVQALLRDGCQARHVVVGAGFTFGQGQSGDLALLRHLGGRHGFEAHGVPLLRDGDVEISSSRIRRAIAAGELLEAGKMLGRAPLWEGEVVHGAQRGKTLGFGTANLRPDNELPPAVGVYAGAAHGPFGTRPAVVNVGVCPTFGAGQTVRMEVHLLQYDGTPLYGHRLEVALFERLRDEKKFADVQALKTQIAADAQRAAQLMAARPSLPK